MGEPLIIPYVLPDGASGNTDVWLQAEQADIPDDAAIDWANLIRMIAYGRSGMSATGVLVDNCPIVVDGETVQYVALVNVYPSSLDLPYRVHPVLGEVGETVVMVTTPREFDLVFDMREDGNGPDILIDPDSLNYTWQTPCWNGAMRKVKPPAIIYRNGRFLVDRPVFGIARVKARAVGWQHQIIHTWPIAPGVYFDEPENKVQITWQDGGGEWQSETVDLVFPPCLSVLLNFCDGSGRINFGPREAGPVQVRVYFNECAGEPITTLIIPPLSQEVTSDG